MNWKILRELNLGKRDEEIDDKQSEDYLENGRRRRGRLGKRDETKPSKVRH